MIDRSWTFSLRLPRALLAWSPRVPVLCFALALAAVLLLPEARSLALRSGDTFMHIRIGESILGEHALPRLDTLSYTWAGAPYSDYEWLFQLIVALVYRALGLDGLVWFAALALGGVGYWLAARALEKGADHLAILATWLFSGWLCWDSIRVRPQLFSYAGFALGFLLLERPDPAGARDLRKPVAVFALLALWTNLHPYALVFAALLAVELAGRALKEGPRARGWFAALLVATALGTLATPLGWHLPGLIVRFQRDPILKWIIEEHQPLELDSTRGLVFLATLPLLAGICWLRRTRLRAAEVITLVATAALAWSARRNLPLFAIAAFPWLAQAFSAATAALLAPATRAAKAAPHSAPPPSRPWRATSAWLAGLTAVSLGFVVFARAPFSESALHLRQPAAAVDYLAAHLDELGPRMFNAYEFGGYLDFALPERKVFIDGRAELFGGDFVRRAVRTNAGGAEALTELNHWNVDWAIFHTGSNLERVLTQAGWTRRYVDTIAEVFTRK